MDKQEAIGELLYLISNTQKATLDTSRIWTFGYVKSIQKSMEILEKLVLLLDSDHPVSLKSMSFAFDHLAWKKFTLSDEARRDMQMGEFLTSRPLTSEYKHISVLMLDVIREVQRRLKRIIHQDKKQIWSQIHSLHNLALTLLHNRESVLFNDLVFNPLTVEDGLAYAKMDLSEIDL